MGFGRAADLDVARGPRTSHDPAAGARTVLAYRAWAQRAGGQRAAFAGESSGLPSAASTASSSASRCRASAAAGATSCSSALGRLGVADARASSLQFTDDAATTAAKRVFGIGDKILLERRARDLADAADLPIEALDLGLFNWAAPALGRATMGSRAVADDGERDAIAGVLGSESHARPARSCFLALPAGGADSPRGEHEVNLR